MIPAIIAGAAALVSIGSSVIGNLMAKGDRNSAEAILERAKSLYGDLTPASLEKAAMEVLGPSAFASIKKDIQYEQAKRSALGKLTDEVNGEGYTIEDQAVQNEFLNKSARDEAAGRGAISENMAARGIGGSGAEIGMMFAGAQASADRNAKNSMGAAAEARKRYMQAILAQGNMAGQYARDDWSQQSQAAQATDAINRWNAESRQRGTAYNNTLAQMEYQNRLGLADRQAGLYRDQAAAKTGSAQATQQMWGGIGSAVMQAGSAAASYGQAKAPLTQTSATQTASPSGAYGPMADSYATPDPYAGTGYQPWKPEDWRPE